MIHWKKKSTDSPKIEDTSPLSLNISSGFTKVFTILLSFRYFLKLLYISAIWFFFSMYQLLISSGTRTCHWISNAKKECILYWFCWNRVFEFDSLLIFIRKSTLLRYIIHMLPRASTFVTASTGVAAVNIGGATIHSFAGKTSNLIVNLIYRNWKGERQQIWVSTISTK